MSNNAPRRANIYDVAKLAGVSHQTVSRVLNGHPGIRPTTRERVELAAKELNYQPSMAARALVTKSTKMLGFLVGDTSLFGPAGWLSVLERQARHAGYYAVTITVKNDRPDTWADPLDHLRRLGVEGVICVAIKPAALRMVSAVCPNVPIVGIDSDGLDGVTTVGIDNHAGAKAATDYLISLGHREILHMSGPHDSSDANQRLSGYLDAITAANLKPHVVNGDWSIDTGHRLGLEIDFDRTGITAVFAANDHLALGLMKALRTRGISVPQQVSIVGFDDIPEARFFDPALTTVIQEFNLIGEAAIEQLIYLLAGLKAPKSKAKVPQLAIRESTRAI